MIGLPILIFQDLVLALDTSESENVIIHHQILMIFIVEEITLNPRSATLRNFQVITNNEHYFKCILIVFILT